MWNEQLIEWVGDCTTNVVHEGHSLEENDKENMCFTSFWWKSNTKGFQQMHPMFKSGTITSKLKLVRH